MAAFLVEAYVSEARAGRETARARILSIENGAGVRCVRAIYVPDDETCFYLFDGPSIPDVAEVATRAGLADFRIVAAVAYEREEGSEG